jgi:uncharacterized protein (TIGR01777 family)
VRSIQRLSETLAQLRQPPRVLLTTSSLVHYYGDRGDEVLTEHAPASEKGFLTAVIRDRETAIQAAAAAGIRAVPLRLGLVLSPRGGLLRLLLPWFRLGLGGCYGTPGRYLSWIGVDDLLGALYHTLLTDTLTEPVNVVSPNPVTMETFARTLARVLGRPAALRLPSPLVRLVLGEEAEDTFLTSVGALPARLHQTRFDFRYADLEHTFRHLLGRTVRR